MANKKLLDYTPDEDLQKIGEEPMRYRGIETAKDVLQQMNIIYALTRQKKIETQDYARLVNGLNSMAGVIKDSDIEKRLKDIEALLNK